MGRLNVFTAFSGYDSQCMALDRLGIDYILSGWSEIDKYAIEAHNAIYPQWADRNYGDISKIDWKSVPDFDLFTYSFPCTDISSAGQQKGLSEGSGTRSSLLWECRKAIEIKKPKYLLMENVKALTSKKFMPYLQKWLAYLDSMGYTSYTKVLNAKDYGVPQNRERVFVVSILNGDRYYFPKPFQLEKRLKDVLEENVDEKYYLSKKMVDCFIKRTELAKEKGNGFKFSPTNGDCVAKAITTCAGNRTDDNFIYTNKRLQEMISEGMISGDKVEFVDAYNKKTNRELCGTITTWVDASNLTFISEPKYCTMLDVNLENSSNHELIEQRIELGGEVANCITTVQKDSLVVEPTLRIRQATKQGYVDIKPGSLFDASYPNSKTRRGRVQGYRKLCPTLTAQGEPPCYYEKEPKIIKVGNYSKSEHNASTIINTDGIAPNVMENHGTVTAIAESNTIEWKGKKMKNGDGLYTSTTDKFFHGGLNGISRTLKAEVHDAGVIQNYRIRKLTPRECFRLMGVSEENIDKIQSAGISRTQQYKMAGNSIVVDVLYHIFRKMFIDKSPETSELSFF